MAELIAGSGYGDVQNTAPSNPSIGDTWLDTSGSEAVGKIYADLGSGADWQILPVQNELQSGRTRELLMLLQDKPVPEVVDPLNIQSGLSENYQQDGEGDYEISDGSQDGTSAELFPTTNTGGNYSSGVEINPNTNLKGVKFSIDGEVTGVDSAYVLDNNYNVLTSKSIGGDPSVTYEFDYALSEGTVYYIAVDGSGGNYTIAEDDSTSMPLTTEDFDITGGIYNDISRSSPYALDSVTGIVGYTNFSVTDRFAAPTTEPADFAQWNAIRAKDVTTGGSTSADPVEFEILDSTDTALNSTRIPKARIADEPFTMRNRVYTEDAGSDGQSDYTIPTAGDGGHFGIPILTIVSVKQNGSVLDSANWSFDGPDTVTIDTSNVTIEIGDTIDIKYDFDVFDSTLQPRAYLNRASTSETSPSISHFRYEYVI